MKALRMSGPVETELPPSAYRRREKLRLTLTMNNRAVAPVSEPSDLKSQVRTIDCHELARRIKSSNNKLRLPFILLDCRGYLCYTDSHIRGAVHIACTDRFNRKRVQNAGSVLDLVSTNNRRNKTHNNAIYHNAVNGKYRDVIVYDEGNTDLNLEAAWANPISFVLVHLLQENRQPIYLNGGMKEFTKLHGDLCDSSTRKDLSIMPSSTIPSPLPSPLSPSSYSMTASTPRCIDSYENEPPTQVLPFLYVGNARDAANVELLQRLKIRYVLSVTMVNPCLPSHASNTTVVNTVPATKCDHWNGTSENNGCNCSMKDRQPELRTKLIPVSDNLCENLAPYFDEACDFIEEARKSGWSILIHCQAGISRSPTIAIAYIMKHTKLSTLEAYAFVQRCRRIISPNLNFMGQLVEFESKLKSGDSNPSPPASTPTNNSTSNNTNNINANSHLSSGSEALSTCFSSSSPCSSENTCQDSVDHHLLLPNISVNVRNNSSSNASPCTTAPGSATMPMILAD